MAIYILGVDADQRIRSIGGNTFGANFIGPYIRKRAYLIKKSPTYLSNRRVNFRSVITKWAGLSAVNKTLWINKAAVEPLVNSLGVIYFVTGYQSFVSRNVIRANQGLGIMSTPIPTVPVPGRTLTFVQVGLTLDSLIATFDVGVVGAPWSWRIYATPFVSVGTEFVFPDHFLLLTTLLPGTFLPYNLTADFIAKIGDFPLKPFTASTVWTTFVHLQLFNPFTSQCLDANTVKSLVLAPGFLGVTTILPTPIITSFAFAVLRTPTFDGTASAVTVYHTNNGGLCIVGIYDDVGGAPGNLLAVSAATAMGMGPGFKQIDFPAPLSFAGEVPLWIAVVGNGFVSFASGACGFTTNQATIAAFDLPDPFGASAPIADCRTAAALINFEF